MINGKEIIINAALIETVEANPDTTITTTTGRKYLVRETAEEVAEKVAEYCRRIYGKPDK